MCVWGSGVWWLRDGHSDTLCLTGRAEGELPNLSRRFRPTRHEDASFYGHKMFCKPLPLPSASHLGNAHHYCYVGGACGDVSSTSPCARSDGRVHVFQVSTSCLVELIMLPGWFGLGLNNASVQFLHEVHPNVVIHLKQRRVVAGRNHRLH